MKAFLILCAALILIVAVVLVGLRIVRATRLWPAALLIVTAPLEVYRTSSEAGANVSVFRLALVVSFVAFGVDLARGRRRVRFLPLAFGVYGVLVGWEVISYLFVTANQPLAHRFIGQYVAGLAAAFLITCYVERRDLRVVAGVGAGAAIVPLLAAAYRVFSVSHGGSGDLPGLTELPLNLAIEGARQGGSFLLDGTQRLNATFADPNLFGFYVATAFLLCAGAACGALFFQKPIHWRTASSYMLLVSSTAVALVGTYSRSAWFLAAVGLAVLAALLGRSFWTRRRLIAACSAAIIAIGLASPLVIARLNTSEPGNVKSTQVHEHTLSTALKLMFRHPLTGVGLGGFGRYVDEPPIVSGAVSTFLTVGAELGITGLALLLTAIAVTSLAAIRSVQSSAAGDRALLAGLVTAFVGLAVANAIYDAWMDDFQWVLFGVVLALTTQPGMALRGSPFRRRREIRHDLPLSGSEQAQVAA